MDDNDRLAAAGGLVIVGRLARERILERLARAREVAEHDLAGGLDRVRALVRDVADRLDALELARVAADGPNAPAQGASRLAVAALATAHGEPVREFLLIPFGEVGIERPVLGSSFVFTPAHARAAKRWFERMDRKLAVDYEHQSLARVNPRPDGLRPAAGWIGGLEVRGDGLWAVDVTWTERARELLRAGEYRYFSPVIYWADEDQVELAALGPVALTNDPAMRGVKPLAAGRQSAAAVEAASSAGGADDAHGVGGDADAGADTDTGAGADTDSGAGVPVAVGSMDASDGPHDAEETPARSAAPTGLSRALDAAQREVTLLRRQLARQAADAFVERGLRLGKILESTSLDWREDFLRDAAAAEARLSRAPVLLPPGRVVSLDGGGEAARRPRGPALPDGTPGVEPDDLEAYARAVAAGRVRGRV